MLIVREEHTHPIKSPSRAKIISTEQTNHTPVSPNAQFLFYLFFLNFMKEHVLYCPFFLFQKETLSMIMQNYFLHQGIFSTRELVESSYSSLVFPFSCHIKAGKPPAEDRHFTKRKLKPGTQNKPGRRNCETKKTLPTSHLHLRTVNPNRHRTNCHHTNCAALSVSLPCRGIDLERTKFGGDLLFFAAV